MKILDSEGRDRRDSTGIHNKEIASIERQIQPRNRAGKTNGFEVTSRV